MIDRTDVFVAIVVITAIVLGALGIHCEHQRYARCHAAGGQMHRVRCRQVEDTNCITTDYGNGMVMTTCSPSTSTSCDTACVLDATGQEIDP